MWQALSELLGVRHLRTTSYHPTANGLVERFHHQLKASLKASPLPDRWADMLPLALLGIRTSYKDDLHCTATELVYGTSLRLPGEFFASHDGMDTDPTSYVTHLKQSMRALRCTPTRQPVHRESYVDNSLHTASQVFVRHDAVRRPLQQPYDGPYKVLARSDKFFTLDLNGRKDTVSVDRLKPAHLTPRQLALTHHTPSSPNFTAITSTIYSTHNTVRTTGALAYQTARFRSLATHWRGSNVANLELCMCVCMYLEPCVMCVPTLYLPCQTHVSPVGHMLDIDQVLAVQSVSN